MLFLFLVAIFSLAVFYCIGLFFNDICKVKYINPVISGFILVITLFYIVSFPFMYFKASFIMLCAIYGVVCLIILLFAVLHLSKHYKIINAVLWVKNEKLLIIPMLLILLQIIYIVIFEHSDADDSFYLAITNTILDSGSVNAFEPSTGIEEFMFQQQYSLVAYEVWVAFLCKLTGINTAVFYHTLLPMVLLPIHYIVSYDIAKHINKKRAVLFLLMIALINLFSGYSIYSSGAFAMFRIWQGKSILVNIIFPSLLLVFIQILKNIEVTYREILLISCLLIAGLFSSTIGVYLVPLAYGVYALTYMICRGKIKEFLKMCIPVGVIIPFVIIIYLRITNEANMQIITEGAQTLSYISIVKNIMGDSVIFMLLLIELLYFAFWGNKIEKQVFSVVSCVTFATVLNPLLCNIVAEKITGAPVYWRLFWILQMNYCTASFISNIELKVKNKMKYVFYIAACVAIVFSASFIFNKNNFIKPANAEKIPAFTKTIADTILDVHDEEEEQCYLFMPEGYGYGLRQYTGKIQLVWSRYSADVYKAIGNYEEIEGLYNSIYNEKIINEHTCELLKKYEVDYLVVTNDVVGLELLNTSSKILFEDATFRLLSLTTVTDEESNR